MFHWQAFGEWNKQPLADCFHPTVSLNVSWYNKSLRLSRKKWSERVVPWVEKGFRNVGDEKQEEMSTDMTWHESCILEIGDYNFTMFFDPDIWWIRDQMFFNSISFNVWKNWGFRSFTIPFCAGYHTMAASILNEPFVPEKKTDSTLRGRHFRLTWFFYTSEISPMFGCQGSATPRLLCFSWNEWNIAERIFRQSETASSLQKYRLLQN